MKIMDQQNEIDQAKFETQMLQTLCLGVSATTAKLDNDLVKELFHCCEEGKEWGNVYENGCDNFPVPVKNVSAKNQVSNIVILRSRCYIDSMTTVFSDSINST